MPIKKTMNFNTDYVSINNKNIEQYLNDNNVVINNNANLDLSNLSDEGKKAFFPSNTFINLVNSFIWRTGQDEYEKLADYQAPANGYFYIVARSNDYNRTNEISVWNDTGFGSTDTVNLTIGCLIKGMTVLQKGTFAHVSMYACEIEEAKFIYAEGEV